MNTRGIEAPSFDDIVEGMVISEKRILETTPDYVTLTVQNPKIVIAGYEGANKLSIRAFTNKAKYTAGDIRDFDEVPTGVIEVFTKDEYQSRSFYLRMVYQKAKIKRINFTVTGNGASVKYELDPETSVVSRLDAKQITSQEIISANKIFPSAMAVIKHYTS